MTDISGFLLPDPPNAAGMTPQTDGQGHVIWAPAPVGPQGPAGPQGPVGPQGPPGASVTNTAPSPLIVNGGLVAPAGWTDKIFSDYFAGNALDTTKWFPGMSEPQYGPWRNKGALAAPLTAMGNAGGYAAEYDTPANLIVKDGLTIKLNPDTSQKGYTWAGGFISSNGLFNFPAATKLYVQVRMKCPDMTQGAWPAVWFYDGLVGGEKDLFEGGYSALGNPNETLAFNDHTTEGRQLVELCGVDLTADFHTWGMAFDPTAKTVDYFFDGVHQKQYTGCAAGPYPILINLSMAQNATGWHTVNAGNPGPYQLEVAGVEVYAN